MQQPQVAMTTATQAVIIQQPLDQSGVSAIYNGRAGRGSGIAQLVFGVLALIIGVAEIVLLSPISVVGFGIWAGLLIYIPTGILGIISFNKRRNVVIAYMVMSIISAVTSGLMMLMGAAGAILAVIYCDYQSYRCYPWGSSSVITVDSFLAFMGLMEMVTAIVASAYCCGGVCRRSTRSATVPPVLPTAPPVQLSSVVMGPSSQGQFVPPQKAPPSYSV